MLSVERDVCLFVCVCVCVCVYVCNYCPTPYLVVRLSFITEQRVLARFTSAHVYYKNDLSYVNISEVFCACVCVCVCVRVCVCSGGAAGHQSLPSFHPGQGEEDQPPEPAAAEHAGRHAAPLRLLPGRPGGQGLIGWQCRGGGGP